MPGASTEYYDKVPTKFGGDTAARLRGRRLSRRAARGRAPRRLRRGERRPDALDVNIGAYVDEGTMVDTWATVGSCAEIGRNVHLRRRRHRRRARAAAGEPDHHRGQLFIGARSEIVEGVIVEENSVVSMGVFIGASTRIYDRASGQILYGQVPAGSVVVPGTLPAADGKYGLYCAVIVKRVDAKTRAKTGINELLRGD